MNRSVAKIRCSSFGNLLSIQTTRSLFGLMHLVQRRWKSSNTDVDILIVGGGMVGASLACALACSRLTSTLRIALVESSVPPKFPPPLAPPELRVSAISPGSVRFLQAIGAWNAIESTKRTTSFHSMKVWNTACPIPGHISFGDKMERPLGHIVENNVITAALFERARAFPQSVMVDAPSAIESIEYDYAIPDPTAQPFASRGVLLASKNGKRFSARLVVGADGAQSLVRQIADLPAYGWTYNQRGVVAAVELDRPTATAWQRFLSNGPIALLPMFASYGSIVWSTTPAHADHLLALPDAEFANEVNRALRYEEESEASSGFLRRIRQAIGPPYTTLSNDSTNTAADPAALPRVISVVGKRGSFPLRLSHATSYVRPRIALIGDAAHTVHPLAGQGVNLGFADVAALASAIIEGVEAGLDIGDKTVLDSYERERKLSNAAMLAGLDLLKRAFDTNFAPIALLRNVGLYLVDQVSPMKAALARRATGDNLDLHRIGDQN